MPTKLVDGACPECGSFSAYVRYVGECRCVDTPRVEGGDWSPQIRFKPYFDQAFGCWVDSPRQKQRLLKQHGLVEAGGELEKHVFGKDLRPPDKPIATKDEVERTLAEVREKLRDPEYRRRFERH